MNKYLLLFAFLAVAGCDVKAQNEGTPVGNPDSNNLIILEQNYEAIAPVMAPQPATQQQPDWSQDGNVEVAPAPDNSQATPSGTSNGTSSSAPSSSGGTNTTTSPQEPQELIQIQEQEEAIYQLD